ncbi:ligase-associated DNA damage response exonuclease [soil metagenome]
MLSLVRKGLFCQAGNFHIDPMGAVEHAVITHAHSDHARRGSQCYYTPRSGVELLKARVGKNIRVRSLEFGEKFVLGNVELSFHPAGHILGSAQVRFQRVTTGSRAPIGDVWVASGDYKRDFDPTCEPFEEVKCDVFVTEATFGTPAYQWPIGVDLGRQIFEWWEKNRAVGKNSVLFAYSLGKAQRVLGVLEPFALRPIICHPAATLLNDCYRAEGVKLAKTVCLSELAIDTPLRGELLLVPQAFLKSDRAAILGEDFETAFASGWMAKGSGGYGTGGYDTGFVMSDHADWNGLLKSILATGAKRVYVQHRGQGALVKHLRSLGILAFPDSALALPETNQMSLF